MKNTFFVLTLIVFSAMGVVAQSISGGFKVGANFANQKYDSDFGDFTPDARTSLHLGLFATIKFSENFGVQPELMYNSVGSKFNFGTSGDVVSKLDYLTIPVMLRYSPAKIFNLHAGPQFGMLLSAKQEYNGNSEDMKDNLKGLDLGLGIGAGVDLPMGLGFSARYVAGLSDISDDTNSTQSGKLTNTAIQISVLYKLFGK